jgi:hypothetical protein
MRLSAAGSSILQSRLMWRTGTRSQALALMAKSSQGPWHGGFPNRRIKDGNVDQHLLLGAGEIISGDAPVLPASPEFKLLERGSPPRQTLAGQISGQIRHPLDPPRFVVRYTHLADGERVESRGSCDRDRSRMGSVTHPKVQQSSSEIHGGSMAGSGSRMPPIHAQPCESPQE